MFQVLFSLSFSFLFFLIGSLLLGNAQENLVYIDQGTLIGNVEDDFRSFLGIPYAEPPVGQWRAPRPALKFATNPYDATFMRPDCVQPGNVVMDEDCLFLNLWTPRVSNISNPDFSVMIFFHGGAYTTGGISARALYDGAGIVSISPETIIVYCNYRLGALGFLGSDELAAEDEFGSTGNYGSQDQRLCLIWIQQNIRAFGGDPNRVMIFGESVGGQSVENHLLFPKSAGLFHAALMESGVNNNVYIMNSTEYNEQWGRFSGDMGCNRDPDCMRNFTWQELVEGTASWYLYGEWGLRIDGIELAEDPQIAIKEGRFTKVPTIIGSNKDEIPGDLAAWNLDADDYEDYLHDKFDERYGPEFAQQLAQIYTVGEGQKYTTPWFAVQAMNTHSEFTCAARRHSRWISQYTTVYHYQFRQPLPIVRRLVPALGSFHGTELPFTLRYLPQLLTPIDRKLSEEAVGYWTRFTFNQDPNHADVLLWDQFKPLGSDEEKTLVFEEEIKVVTNMFQSECDLWDSVYPIQQAEKRERMQAKAMKQLVEFIPDELVDFLTL